MKVKVSPPMPLVNGRELAPFCQESVTARYPLMCTFDALCVCTDRRNDVQIIHAFLIVLFFFLHFIQTSCTRGRRWKKKRFFFSIFSRQNTSGPIGKMRNKEFETLYPVSTALCVSQRPGPIIHSSFPNLSLLRMKDKQKPKSSWLPWCFCVKALLLSLDPLLIQCPQVSSLDHTLSFSLNAPLPPLLFPLLSFSLPLQE